MLAWFLTAAGAGLACCCAVWVWSRSAAGAEVGLAHGLQLFAGLAGRHGAEIEDGDVVLGRDAKAHAGAALDGAAGGPRHDGVDGSVEVGSEKDGGVARVEASGSLGTAVPGWMQAFRRRPMQFLQLRGIKAHAVGSAKLVVVLPGQEDAALIGSGALGEGGVGAVGAAAGQMPAVLGKPAGHLGHVVEGLVGCLSRADAGVDEGVRGLEGSWLDVPSGSLGLFLPGGFLLLLRLD